MTPEQWKKDFLYFGPGERYTNGKTVDPKDLNYETMRKVDALRGHLASACYLIRGAHPDRPEAVDACFPRLPLDRVFMALTRLSGCSWGIYTGNSFHVDTREAWPLQSRWVGIRPAEVDVFKRFGLADAIDMKGGKAADWLYVAWSHPKAFEAVKLAIAISAGEKL